MGERPLLPCEALASQGLPVGSEQMPFDFDALSHSVKPAQWYAFAGNGINIPTVEAVLTWFLVSFHAPAPDTP